MQITVPQMKTTCPAALPLEPSLVVPSADIPDGPPPSSRLASMPAVQRRIQRCVEGLLRVPPPPTPSPPTRSSGGSGGPAPDAPLPPPPPPRAAVRAAQLACLDVAAVLYGAPETWIGNDFVSLCATIRLEERDSG